MSESKSLGFPIPVLAAKGAICYECLRPAAKIDRCSGCKRVSYCSKDCQRKNWKKGHKKLCPALTEINTLSGNVPLPGVTWEEYRLKTRSLTTTFRTRYPDLIHSEMVLEYGPYCSVCHRIPFELSKSEKLELCFSCHIAAQCSSCSYTEHSCAQLQKVEEAEIFAIENFQETNEATLKMPTEKPRSEYMPLSTAAGWYDYFAKISDKKMIMGPVLEDLRPLEPRYAEMANALIATTETHSMILTIIAALEVVFPDLATKSAITLHIIGATAKELDILMLFEEIFHLLPALKKLHCAFVGFELPKMVGAEEVLTMDCCSECTSTGRSRSVELIKGAYEDFVQESPDLAVAFNNGHLQSHTKEWKPAIDRLIDGGHTLFTTPNEREMKEETEGLKRMGVEFLVDGELNKWKSMRPLLGAMEVDENAVFCWNQYWYIVKGRNV